MRNLVALVGLCCGLLSRVSCYNFPIPSDFVLGAATSHYQGEGAWNVSDKSVSIYDQWTHLHAGQYVVDGSNGDVATDSYHKYKEDAKLVKELGLDVYRFSISWSRLLPNGYSNKISADGLAYYKNLTKELVDNGIKLVVTLHHMDHPQSIEDIGGFTNPLIVDLFADFARVVFDAIGSHVDTFITINQPNILCGIGYQDFPPFIVAPGKKLGNYGQYLCMHNALKAHAKVWHMYDEEYRSRYNGKIGLNAACYSYEALNPRNTSDYIAVEYGFQFNCGWIWDPIYIGDYPKIMKTRIAALSTAQGYKKSRLPAFTSEEIEYIRGTSDFMGLNYYYVWTARLQTPAEAAANPEDSGIVQAMVKDPRIISVGLYFLLNRISMRYGYPPIFVTENGYGTPNYVTADDYDRISYFHALLTSALSAIYYNGVNVFGYIIWSLVDNWEFTNGYKAPFGLYAVDFASPNRTRTPRLSAKWWKSVLAARKLQPVLTSH